MNPAAILYYPDPRLKVECSRVRVIDEETKKIVEILRLTFFSERGLGLAAPQIGISQRICVVAHPDYIREGVEKANVYINPQIVEQEGEFISREGCLSLPGLWRDVRRYQKVKVEAFDLSGQAFLYEAEDMYAACLQHEIDHLDGVLFVDRLSQMRRKRALKQFVKRGR